VGINDPRPITPEAPFGGVGLSGIGREGGSEGLMEFLEARLIGIRLAAPTGGG
jgi:succinate-semialdehyde dehydrogenase/glutarate-semialdehyde dehydrogenase